MSGYCVSSIHSFPIPGEVHGTYINGNKVWFCGPCATVGQRASLFTPDIREEA